MGSVELGEWGALYPHGEVCERNRAELPGQGGRGHREDGVGRVRMNWEGTGKQEAGSPGTSGPAVLRLPLVRGVAKGEKPWSRVYRLARR